jgi:uncharacterized protein YrrD
MMRNPQICRYTPPVYRGLATKPVQDEDIPTAHVRWCLPVLDGNVLGIVADGVMCDPRGGETIRAVRMVKYEFAHGLLSDQSSGLSATSSSGMVLQG